MHEVVFLNEERVFPKRFDECDGNTSIWYLDNGASNHMTGKRESFSNLEESIQGKVKFDDGSNVEIVGKGSITFIGKTGERRALRDIYYISSLKHNIISLGQATEMGCEVNMKEDLLMLKDPRGRLLVQVTRQSNRLYKTPMEVEYPKCLQIQETDVTWTWHARLGHVNFGVMKNMVDKEMVVGMPQVKHEKDECSTCLVGKQTRKYFPPKSKYRASHTLELVHGDLCGLISPSTPANNRYTSHRTVYTVLLKAMKIPNQLWVEAVRHSTHLINRIATKALENKTPYEGLYVKKPNIEHLRIFGCVAFVKINGPHLKKMDDRSRMVINLGTEPGSKAYKHYDPVAKKIVVSRDVIFDEKKSWDWSTLSATVDEEPGSFKLPHIDVTEEGDGDEHQDPQHHEEQNNNKEEEVVDAGEQEQVAENNDAIMKKKKL
ncbi:PREDICTED: uncharacterized protein LOC106338479 [Brassica oleracea var. oleracea]|uniref:uncharacterized protein LOC106338479 n=1 Tax=Brassica oleracea var. oleracea TaxID=109376 RepID=UPI0006A6A80C|nr:PREDICTED: uncharacterized protein LOC106338479 [Brassica oleracea var. oleracea]